MATKQSIVAKTPRQQLLEEATRITTQDRNKDHGNPEDNFRHIAGFWGTYLTASAGHEIILTPQDVAHMMMLQKIARLATNPQHLDSLVDVAGYAACAEDCRRAAQR